jgi:hypothetical protein
MINRRKHQSVFCLFVSFTSDFPHLSTRTREDWITKLEVLHLNLHYDSEPYVIVINYLVVSSIITNKCTFCTSVTLLPYIWFGCGPPIMRSTLVGSLHWHWFSWHYHKSSQCFCSFCSLSNAGYVRLASKARGITLRVAVIKQYLVGSS